MSHLQNTPKTAIIVAGGTGTRMGANQPKQFLLLDGQPILWHTLQSFLQSYDDLDILLVLPEAYFSEGEKIIASFDHGRKIRLVQGGETRWESVHKRPFSTTTDEIGLNETANTIMY